MIDLGKKEMKLKLLKDMFGVRKKRKFFFIFSKIDKICFDDRNGFDKEILVIFVENCFVKDCKFVSEIDDFICEI